MLNPAPSSRSAEIRPLICTSPDVAFNTPVMIFKIVDFPDHGKDVCDWSDEEIEEMLSTARGVNIRKLKRL